MEVWVIVVAVLLLLVWSAARYNRTLKELGVPPTAAEVEYEGGHPDLPAKGAVKVFARGSDLVLVAATPLTKPQVATVPASAIVQLSLDRNLQVVNTGGGRSITGAVVGGVLAGPVGALVGGRSGTKVKQVDESKTYLHYNQNGMQLQLIFKGGTETYNKLVPVITTLRRT